MIPEKLVKKIKPNWEVCYLDFSHQTPQWKTRFLNYMLGSGDNFLGEYRGLYYFQFDSDVKRDIFLKVMSEVFQDQSIRNEYTTIETTKF